VPLGVKVMPETLTKIRFLAHNFNMSQGELIDKFVSDQFGLI
jgi:hypothetical protein